MKHLALALFAALLAVPACSSDGKSGGDDTDTGTDSDSDTDVSVDGNFAEFDRFRSDKRGRG